MSGTPKRKKLTAIEIEAEIDRRARGKAAVYAAPDTVLMIEARDALLHHLPGLRASADAHDLALLARLDERIKNPPGGGS